jgi:hypothetical protein
LVGAFALVATLGCAGFETRVRDVDLASSPRIAAIPPHVVVSELDASGRHTPNAAWSAGATLQVGNAVAAWTRARGGRTFTAAEVASASPPYADVAHWLDEALESIAHSMYGGTDHRSVGEWRWRSPGLAPWRAALGSDFVLAFRAWDSHETTGRAVASVLMTDRGGHSHQTSIACLLSLADGRVVSCSIGTAENVQRRYLLVNDARLESPESARNVVDYILEGLFPPYEGVRR